MGKNKSGAKEKASATGKAITEEKTAAEEKGAAERRKAAFLEKKMLARRGYACIRPLGEGVFSRVYLAEAAGGAGMACKVSENVKLLEKEAQVLALLRHSLFPEFFDFWTEGGRGFLLREYVPGSSLEEMLERRGGFSPGRTIETGLELAGGLKYLHGRPEKFLFRDVKPANIILRQDGKCRLIDLGCVCSLNEELNSRAGSPGFAAPEQLQRGGVLTAACDVYGLGQTMKAMLGEGRGSLPGNQGTREKRSFCFPNHGVAERGRRRGQIRREKAMGRELWQVLELCTRQEARERIPDMEGLEFALKETAARYARETVHG